MLDVKISYPGAPRDAILSQFCGNVENAWGECRFHLNEAIPVADAWIVIEDVLDEEESCYVPRGNVIFASAESAHPDDLYIPDSNGGRFMSQFDKAYTPYAVFGVVRTSSPLFLPWHINGNHGSHIGPDPIAVSSRDLHWLRKTGHIEKTQDISVFCSITDMTPTHRLRIRFTEQVVEHFGDRIQWFGNGINPVNEKWEGLAPFKYSIVLENRSDFNFITEKVGDVYLAYGFPFYWGAPNLSDYFPQAAYRAIDIRDAERSIAVIERALEDSLFERSNASIGEARNRVPNEFNWMARLAAIVEEDCRTGDKQLRFVRSHSALRGNSRLGTRAKRLARGLRGLATE